MSVAPAVVERVFREESGPILATLIRALGDIDAAEDCLQDALLAALAHWPRDGVPPRPGAWITTVARRKAIDRIRRRARDRSASAPAGGEVLADLPAPVPDALEELRRRLDEPVRDDLLRLVFTCCHPALSLPAQVALTLHAAGGLTTAEIARAFLLPEATLAQRLVRAKRKVKEAGIPYRVPPEPLLRGRLAGVLSVVYLVFSEGHAASGGEAAVRGELCAEAIRLGRLLAELLPREPEVDGLLALMLLTDARRPARLTGDGEIVLLEQQDRARWDRALIDEGLTVLARADTPACACAGPPAAGSRGAASPATGSRGAAPAAGPYRLQARIAAVHAAARSAAETDWPAIVALYDELLAAHASPVVALNRAVAVAMVEGPERGVALLDELDAEGALARYRYLHAARGELLRRAGRHEQARAALARALELTDNAAERRLLRRRLDELDVPPRDGSGPGAGR